jgi:hypothetical protein
MPTVARYGGRKVDINAYPGVRRQAHETAESSGLEVAQAGQRRAEVLGQIGNAGFTMGAKEAARLYQEERDRADDIANLSANTQLGQWLNTTLYDPTSGALTARGKDAFDLPEKVSAAYEKKVGELAGTLTNDKQRFRFQQYAAQQGLVTDHTVRTHTYEQMTRFETEELKAFLDTSQQRTAALATQPEQVGLEIESQVAALKTHGPRLGMGPEQLDAAVAATRSQSHTNVVDTLLTTEKPKQAQAYFEGVKDQIDPAQRKRLESAIRESGDRQEGQRRADEILAAGGTLSEQLEKAGQIEDVDVRTRAEAYLEHKHAIRKQVDQEALEQASIGAYNILDRTHGDLMKIPASTWQSFPGGLRTALEAYADFKQHGRPVETDFATYYTLRKLAADDPQAFVDTTKTDLNFYRHRLSTGDLKALAELQADLKTANAAKALKFLGPAKLQDDAVDDMLTLYGIDTKAKPTSEVGKKTAALRDMLRRRVEYETAAQQKEQDSTQVRHYLDEIMTAQGTAAGASWNPWAKAYKKPILDLRVQDIPPGERKTIEDRLRAHGQPASDATVLTYYRDLKELEQRPVAEVPPALRTP